jgi:DNA replication protein DnaC
VSAPSPAAAEYSKLLAHVRLLTPEEAEAERVGDARPEIVRLTRSFASKLGPKIDRAEFQRRVPDRRLQALVARYALERGSLLIIGGAGTGKTETAKRVARRLLSEAWKAGDLNHPVNSAVWTTALELATQLRSVRLGVECSALREAQRAGVLFLDELGQENWDPRWLLELLDVRYSPRSLPTITTSGLTHAQLVERYGSGAVRRLTEPRGTLVDLHPGGG